MKNIGSFAGTFTFPIDLYERGQIVGLSTLKGDQHQHAFLWENDSFYELPNTIGGKNSAAIQLNNDGVAVGWVSTSVGLLPQVAALWKEGEMRDDQRPRRDRRSRTRFERKSACVSIDTLQP
jgi:probable HAF family extracellular repeat protein